MNEVEVLKEAYAALNRNDVEGFVKDFDPDIERVEFEGTPMAGTFIGIDEVREHVIKGRSTWAEGSCEPERFVANGDMIIVLTHVRVRLKNQTEWLEGNTADVFTFRNGKITEFRTFSNEHETFEYAGVTKAIE
jgi:ketosteroid isomerase-like protein